MLDSRQQCSTFKTVDVVIGDFSLEYYMRPDHLASLLWENAEDGQLVAR